MLKMTISTSICAHPNAGGNIQQTSENGRKKDKSLKMVKKSTFDHLWGERST